MIAEAKPRRSDGSQARPDVASVPGLQAEGSETRRPLYDTDFYSWAAEQARLLRAGRTDLLDVDNIAEEIETLGRSEAAALRSSYRLICLHLLKMIFQAERATRSWENTVHRERLNAESTLADDPGLQPRRGSLFEEGYALARREASFETRLDLNLIPNHPPFSITQAEASDFWPEGFPAGRQSASRMRTQRARAARSE